jgi:putative transposase
MLKTYQYRIKDSSSKKILNRLKRSVNFVWNFCNETQKLSLKRKDFLGKYDFSMLTSGTSKELGLHSQTVQGICEEYSTRVTQFRKPFLRWRSRRHLGWIPSLYV